MLDGLMNTRLQYLGVNTSPDKKDTEETARMGAIRQFAHQYVLDRQRQLGKKIETTADMQNLVNELFTKNDVTKGWFGGQKSFNVMTADVDKLPGATRKALETRLKTHLGRDPSDAEVLQAYLRSQYYSSGGTVNAGGARR